MMADLASVVAWMAERPSAVLWHNSWPPSDLTPASEFAAAAGSLGH